MMKEAATLLLSIDAAGVVTLGTQVVPGDDEVPPEEWEARVRPHFDGEVLCPADLDEFPLGS